METATLPRTQALATVAPGLAVTVVRVLTDTSLARRLAALGVRPGATVSLRHRAAGGGRVIAVAGARMALDRSVLDLIEVAGPAHV